MQDNFKQIPWLVLAVGMVVYAFCVVNNTDVETYTGLTLMITLGAWACLNIAMDSFNLGQFIKVFAAAGYLFAITVFIFSGVEEVSFPEGAFVFHLSHIVKSIGIIFIASLPLLYFYDSSESKTVTSSSDSDDVSDDNWEAASQEDLDSGQWELEG